MPHKPLSFSALGAVCLAALTLWISAGTLTVATADTASARYGLLPSPGWLALAGIGALILALAARPTPRAGAILATSALVLLPWMPMPIPTAALVWTGHLRLWLWLTIVIVLVWPPAVRAAGALAIARDPRRAPWLAAALTALVALIAARQVYPRLPGGDEPHYLVIAQSLLIDHDLKIENNHRRGDYRAYFRGDLKPDYLRRGADGEIYSIHAPGLPALVAPAFALFGYPGVMVALTFFTACGAAFAWTAAWRVTNDLAASWFAWAVVALTVPFFFQTFVVFPDGPGAALVMAAVATALLGAAASEPLLAATGVGLALLPWLHTRFAILAAIAGAIVAARQIGSDRIVRRVAILFAAPGVSAIAWFAFFSSIYGTPNPAAPYGGYTQTSAANLPRGIAGLLFDQQFGILPNAPAYACAALGFAPLARRSPRIVVELLLLIVPYTLAVAAYQMWWAGFSSPARFAVPVLLTLSIPAAAWFASADRPARTFGLLALLFSVLITGALFAVDRGALLYNTREAAAARWLLWLSPVVNVATGVPSLFQNTPRVAVWQAVVWILAAAATAWIAQRAERRGATSAGLVSIIVVTAAVGAMAALTIVWRSNGARPTTPASGALALLRQYDPQRAQLAVGYAPLRRLPNAALPAMLPLADVQAASVPANQPLAAIARPPAGDYEFAASLAGAGAGRIGATVDREFGPLWSWDLAGASGVWRATIAVPIDVAGIRVDADAAARRSIDRLSLRAARIDSAADKIVTAEPVHATRLGPAILFLVGGHAYTERAGTWVAGGDSADFVIAPDQARSLLLFVRNFAIDNRVTLVSGSWRQELTLRPREERLLDLPLDSRRRAIQLTVTSAAGARPSEVEPGNGDSRYLGCWIEVR